MAGYEWDMFTTCFTPTGSDHGGADCLWEEPYRFPEWNVHRKCHHRVHPYWKHSEDGTLMELLKKVVVMEQEEGTERPYEKITPLELYQPV
jgi:hypothetical protein